MAQILPWQWSSRKAASVIIGNNIPNVLARAPHNCHYAHACIIQPGTHAPMSEENPAH